MVVHRFAKILIITVLIFSANSLFAEELEKWNLHENKTNHPDYLSYKLKYRGFITLFIWKNLADVAFSSGFQTEDFQGNESCQLEMKLTTENYSFSESLHPYRYQWRSKVSPDLSKVFLVEEIGDGTEKEYNVHWLNWKENVIDFFHQRQLIVPEIDVFADEEEYNSYSDDVEEKPEPYWEKDGKKPMPAYYNHLPKFENGHDYLVYDKSLEFDQITKLIDPLAMIFTARWYNNIKLSNQVFNVSHKDEIREYRMELLGEEVLNIGEQEISATKIYIKRKNEEKANDEGFIAIWVSNDARRIPLKYEVEVRVGTIHVELTEKSLQDYNHPKSCLTVTHSSNK